MFAGEAAAAEGFREGLTAFHLRPILGVAEEAEVPHPAFDEMFRGDLAGLGVVLDHVGERGAAATQGEVDRRLVGFQDEVGEVVAGAEPSEDAVAFPAPGNHLLVDDAVGGQMPAVFRSIGGDALEQPVVIPAEGEKHVPRAFHGLVRLIKAAGL